MVLEMRQADIAGTPVTRGWAQDRTRFLTFPQLNPRCSFARPTSPAACLCPACLALALSARTMGSVNARIYGHENKYIKRARKGAIHETLLQRNINLWDPR